MLLRPRARARSLAPALLLTIVALAGPGSSPAGASSPAVRAGKVINGTQVSPASFAARWSSIAGLLAHGERDARVGQFCGGTFISPTVVLTAAHCVTDQSTAFLYVDGESRTRYNQARTVSPKLLDVLGGRRVLSDRNGVIAPVSHIVAHPQYDSGRSRFDVAVVVLKAAVPASAGITPVPPVGASEDLIWGAGGGIAPDATNGPWIGGWGYRDISLEDFLFSGADHALVHRPANGAKHPNATAGHETARSRSGRAGRSVANTLEEAAVPIRSDAVCEAGGPGQGTGFGRDFDAGTMLCAGVLDNHDLNDANATTTGVDTCYGDSGGPLFAGSGAGMRVVGITSFGSGCATRSSYGVYTRVAAMRPFLAKSPTKPVTNTVEPTVTGSRSPGGVLRCDRGKWAGAGPLHYKLRWVREPSEDDEGSTGPFLSGLPVLERVPHSTGSPTYRLRTGDAGTHVSCMIAVSGDSSTLAEVSEPVRVLGGDDDEDEDSSDDEESGF